MDESKLVERLGAFGLPLEVLPFAPGVVAERVRAHFGEIADPTRLAGERSAIPGASEFSVDYQIFA